MEEINKLEDKIKKDEKYLQELKNRKFNKNDVITLRREKRENRKAEWLTIRSIIRYQIRLAKITGKKIVISKLAISIGKSDKTAKKYYLLVLNGQELEYKYNINSAWNNKNDLKIKVVDLLFKAIQRTDNHMGQKVMVSLADLIDDISIDLKGQKLKYSTVHRWIRNIQAIDYKYSSRKRRRTLKKIKAVNQRIEENKNSLMFLRKFKAQNIKNAIVEESMNVVNETKEDKVEKEKFLKPGSIIQLDGGEDIIYQNKKINRLQTVDITGYSYGIIYTPTETNIAYILSLIEVFKVTWPLVILVDRRKGVDPKDLRAIVAAICRNLNITVFASSDPNHKALVEKDHGLIRSKASLHFSRHNVQNLEQAREHANIINNSFNKKHKYSKPKYDGKKISKDIIDFLVWDLKVIIPYNTSFIYFKKNAYQIIDEHGKPLYLDTNDIYVAGAKNKEVNVLFKCKLYRTQLIPKINLTSKEFANSLLRDKFRQNAMIVMTKESAKFWIEQETKSISHFTEKRVRKQYQDKMINLFQENYKLKEKLRKST